VRVAGKKEVVKHNNMYLCANSDFTLTERTMTDSRRNSLKELQNDSWPSEKRTQGVLE
jgi:hypothetical protein